MGNNQYNPQDDSEQRSRLVFEPITTGLSGCRDFDAMVILHDSVNGELIVEPWEIPALIAFLFRFHPQAGPTSPLPNDTIPQD